MLESSEDMFFNDLVGCWTGREYQRDDIIYKIVNDGNLYVTFRIMIKTKDGRRKMVFRHTKLKKPLEEYLLISGYKRVK